MNTSVKLPSTFKRLLRFALSDKRLMWQALALLLLATAADVAGPLLIKTLLDDYIVPANWQVNQMLWLGAAYLLLMLLAALTHYWQAIKLNIMAQHAVQQLRHQLFAKVMDMPLSFFDRTPTGTLISRITNDTEAIKELYVNVIGTFVQNIVRIIGILIAMALLDASLMLICLVLLPVVVTMMFYYQRLSAALFHRARSLLSDINTRLHESVQGMKVIQLLGQQPRFRRDFSQLADEHHYARLRNVKLDSILLRPAVDLLQKTALAGLLLMFGSQSLQGAVEIGVLYAFVTYLGRFSEPLVEMTQRLSLYQQAIVAGERVFSLLDTENSTPPRQAEAQIAAGQLSFQQVQFSYTGEQQVIKNISLQIPAGSFYALIGHTGSGKSTLVQLLLRFYQPQQGQIEIDGQPLDSYSEAELRQRIGIVQQDPFIFSSSVRDNITLGQDFSEQQVIAAAESAGFHQHVLRMPQAYQTQLNERGSNLSTGQRQLLALARTLIRQPKILILDEATANIDSHTEAQIQQVLMALRGSITLVAIAHRLSTIEKADQIVVLHHGEMVQLGKHSELVNQDGIYRQLYQMQGLQLG